jgi:hypothetical protein
VLSSRRRLLSLATAVALAVTPCQAATAADGPVFPRPGGGPKAIHVLNEVAGQGTHLLDTDTGTYRALPFLTLTVSPDGRLVAVEREDGHIGVAERRALLRLGATAVRWTELYSGVFWSPDGTALLHTSWDRGSDTFTAQRYDVRTGLVRDTPISLDCDTCTAGWAADSIRYTVMLRGTDPESPTGPARYLNPDGTAGPLVGADGMIWDADSYSPSRRYVVVEPPRPFIPDDTAGWQRSKIFDLRSKRVVGTLSNNYWPVSGWYDDSHVVRTARVAEGEPTALEIIDVRTGAVTRRIAAPGLPQCCVQLGSSARLHGAAARLGF